MNSVDLEGGTKIINWYLPNTSCKWYCYVC